MAAARSTLFRSHVLRFYYYLAHWLLTSLYYWYFDFSPAWPEVRSFPWLVGQSVICFPAVIWARL
jgi:hypothetical protein